MYVEVQVHNNYGWPIGSNKPKKVLQSIIITS